MLLKISQIKNYSCLDTDFKDTPNFLINHTICDSILDMYIVIFFFNEFSQKYLRYRSLALHSLKMRIGK